MRSWPFDGSCDFDVRRRSGWAPAPLNEFIFKAETRCNLNCDYCYVYNLGDDSWRSAPRYMDLGVARQAARRIREHAIAHGLPRVGISLHGGEPLLRGSGPVRELVDAVREELGPVAAEFSMQTNATLVTDEIADVLSELGIRVGVSIDGDEYGNRHRLDLGGKSSYERTRRGIERLRARDGLLQGALAVIDLQSDPVATYEAIVGLGFRSVDFLLPHATWEQLPAGKSGAREHTAEAPYAEWLLAIYRQWSTEEPRPQIRIFDDVIHLLLGGSAAFEGLGLGPTTLAVIEADGSVELVDHIGVAYDGAESTGANVATHTLDDVLRHPGVVCRQIGIEALADECVRCPLVAVCGGGLITHRFDHVRGFRNRSVYCADLFALISTIRADLTRRLTAPREAVAG
jgi:uncharacterized protein